MINFLAKYLILPRDYIKLFSNSDIVDLEEIKRDQKIVYLGILATFVLNLLRAVLLILAFQITVNNKSNALNQILTLFIASVTVGIVKSIVENYHIATYGSKTYWKYFNILSEEVEKLKTKEIARTFSELYSTGSVYAYYIQNYFGVLTKIGVLFATVFILQQKSAYIFEITLLTFTYFMLTIIFGYYFYHKGSLNVRAAFLAREVPLRIDIIKRVVGPIVCNLTTGEFIAFASILIILLDLPEWAFFLVIVSNLQGLMWSLISNLENIKLAKRYLTKINNYFDNLNLKYIYNENTFNQYLIDIKDSYKKKKPTSVTGLELIDYAPMNGSKSPRIFNFHFMQGMYKLIGINGVGKTTLLKSFGLTNDYLVEKPTGYAFLNGEPLFRQGESLKKHRQKVIFLSKNTKEPKLKTLNKYKELTPSVLIHNLISNIKARETLSFSEGEAAVIEILNALIDIPNKGILIIDELLARIHDGDVYNLRTELVALVESVCSKKKLIVITVDHAIEIPNAKLVSITEKALTTK